MNINQTLKLQCRYSGDPNIRQDWYLKGKSLVDGYAKTSRGKYVLNKQNSVSQMTMVYSFYTVYMIANRILQ